MKVLELVLVFCLITSFAFADTVRIQVLFKEQTPYGEYNDALYFTPEEYESVGPIAINAMKQKRVANWVYAITHPAPYIKPTLEELKSMRTDHIEEVNKLMIDILNKATVEELREIENEYLFQLGEVQIKIGEKEITPIE